MKSAVRKVKVAQTETLLENTLLRKPEQTICNKSVSNNTHLYYFAIDVEGHIDTKTNPISKSYNRKITAKEAT